ncbi:MAG: GntR family transcriptional regulator [Gemmatimonadota bacterium]
MTSGESGEGRMPDVVVRDHHVALRRQLAAGLEAAIRDGHLGPGSHLPSTREMANRLGLHRSTVTAAYARLRRRGCVVGGAGARVRVRSRASGQTFAGLYVDLTEDSSRVGATAEDIAGLAIGGLLGTAVQRGVSREATLRALAITATSVAERARMNRRRVILFEPRPGLRRLLEAELSQRLDVRVDARATLGGTKAWDSPPLLVRAELAERVARTRPRGLDTIALHLAGGTRERGFVRRTARGGLVTLVTVSRSVRRYARDLAAREFGRGISFLALDPSDTRAVHRAAHASRLVLFDEPSRSAVPPTRAPAHPIRLLTETQIVALRTYLDVPGPRTGRPSSELAPRRRESRANPRRGT